MFNKTRNTFSQSTLLPPINLNIIFVLLAIIVFTILTLSIYKIYKISSQFVGSTSFATGVNANGTYFSVGPGFNDNVPRQFIRTSSDRVYLIGSVVGTSTIKVYWNPSGGYPNATSDFSGSAQQTNSSNIFVVDAAYDGGNFIHILTMDMAGNLTDYPFDTSTNSFRSGKIISSGNSTPASETNIGTTGVSSMFNSSGALHIANWSGSNHISYQSYTYNASTDTLTQTSGPTQLDSAGGANHPELVVSPLDQSVTVSWIVGTGTADVYVRTKPSGGTWGSVEKVNTSAAWGSTSSGINIDQGPSMVIASDGTKSLIYIENFGSCGTDYGRLHYVSRAPSASTWTDQRLSNFCTHAPGLAIDSSNNIYALGHGHPSNPSCKKMTQVCSVKRNSDGTWNNPVVFATPPRGDSFDDSVSTKWSAVGWNRPETIEFVFFDAIGGSYTNTALWYGRLATTGTGGPTPTPAPTSAPIPTPNAPTSTPVPTPTATPIPTPPTSGTITLQIKASSDDVNQDNATFTSNSTTVWLGNGTSTTASYAGLRFINVTIPPSATVVSAKLQVYSFQSQWISVNMSMAADATGNSATFSASSLPSQRTLTTQKISHSSNSNWNANTWYTLDEMAPVLQEVISRADWVSGNSLSLILKGTGGAYGRKNITGWDGSSANAAKLVITYQ